MIYYLVLVFVLILKFKLKKDEVFFLWIGFYLFLVSIILDLLKIKDYSEFVIRVGFEIFLFGFIFVAKESIFKK